MVGVDDLVTKSSKCVAKEKRSDDEENSDEGVHHEQNPEQLIGCAMRNSDLLSTQLKTKVGGSCARDGEKKDGRIIDEIVSCLGGRRRLAIEELGHFYRYNPVLKAEQPVDDYREEEEKEDSGRYSPCDQVGLRVVVKGLFEVVAAREVEGHKVLQDAQHVHELDPSVPGFPEDENRSGYRYNDHDDADCV